MIDLQVHANIGCITGVLGRRLINLTRRLGAKRLAGTSGQPPPEAGTPGAAVNPGAARSSGLEAEDPLVEFTPSSSSINDLDLSLSTLFPGFRDGFFGLIDPVDFGFGME